MSMFFLPIWATRRLEASPIGACDWQKAITCRMPPRFAQGSKGDWNRFPVDFPKLRRGPLRSLPQPVAPFYLLTPPEGVAKERKPVGIVFLRPLHGHGKTLCDLGRSLRRVHCRRR